ncbi:hypothetical protein GF389_04070 [Candidatus Dojkabacteria bacterium]|nr:hypothetical protein [Candidatus Dojkabacteria bacterium]
MKYYNFGYATLINKESLLKTTSISDYIPIKIEGIETDWNISSDKFMITGIGLSVNDKARALGVLIELTEDNFINLDERELQHGHERVELSYHSIVKYEGQSLDLTNSKIYTYKPRYPKRPNVDHPIVQSYLDTVLDGCLSISDNFAKEYLEKTIGWNDQWINDRAKPMYPSYISPINPNKIDSILSSVLPEYFSKRKNI